jgi:PST family polysaccharide transporter
MATTVAALGVHGSGVRQIALAVSSGDMAEVGRVIKTLRRILTTLGLIGMVVMAVLAWPISYTTFRSGDYYWQIMLLSLAVPMIMATYGRMAVVQGLGRMRDLARQNVWGGIMGSALAIVLILTLREKGIVFALLSGYTGSFLAAWWFGRKIDVPPAPITWRESFQGAGIFLKLGLAFMNASLLATLVLYIARATITQTMGLAAVGIYVCAFSLSGKFVGLVIEPMWADFFPRASSLAEDNEGLNRSVNEQTEVTLLLAAPGILATLIFAPVLVRIFYSSDFTEAPLLMRWFTLGCLCGIVEAPVRVIQMAKGKSLLCLFTETIGGVVHVVLIMGLLHVWSLKGCAIAYLLHNAVQLALSWFVAKRLSGFSWTPRCVKMIVLYGLMAAVCFAATWALSLTQLIAVGLLAIAGVMFYSVRELVGRLGTDHRVSRMLAKLPFFGAMVVRG